MRRQFLTLVLLATLTACSDNSSTSKTVKDSLVTEPEAESPAGTQQLATVFPSLFRFYKEQDPTFSPQKFEEAGTGSMDSSAAQPVEEEQMKPYYPYLVYNSDSTYAVDLYSSNYVITTRDNKTVVEEGGPDTEVAIIDLKNKTRKRVFFGGTPTAVYDARWISNTAFLLATAEMLPEEGIEEYKIHPELLLYDIAQQQVTHLVYPDTLEVKKGAGYRDNRLPGGE